MTDLDAIRARHVPVPAIVIIARGEECQFERQEWPCDTATVLALLDEAEAREAEQREVLEYVRSGATDD